MACLLIALNKNPGVHSFGIGDVARRIGVKAVLIIIRVDYSLLPRPDRKIGERTWHLLFVHALNFPTFREFQIIPCYLRVLDIR